jgi:hypothetical protein
MWQNVKSVIAFFCILIYIGAAAFAGIKIYEAVNEQRFEAREEFADLTDLASRAGALGLFTNEYIKDIKVQLDMSKALDALIIYGPDNNRFAFEKRAGLISYKGDYPDFNEKVRLYRAPQSAPVRTEGNLNVSISAISPLIDFNTLLSILRSSMLAILAAVCIAFVTLIADVSMVPAFKTPLENEFEITDDDLALADEIPPDAENELPAAGETPPESEFEITDDDLALAADEIPPDVEGELPAAEDELAADREAPPESEFEITDDDLALAAETPPDVDSKKEISGLGLLAAASALYETDSFEGNGQEFEFSGILQHELSRAEADGKDLVLLNIEWSAPGLSCQPLIKQAASFFMEGSRFFEKDEQAGLYIIVPDCDLDEAFAKVKEFHKYAREEKPPEVYAELLVGMTARSLRSVDAINFLNEAEHALDKARSDNALPIVAFKVDPQKYNEFTRRRA